MKQEMKKTFRKLDPPMPTTDGKRVSLYLEITTLMENIETGEMVPVRAEPQYFDKGPEEVIKDLEKMKSDVEKQYEESMKDIDAQIEQLKLLACRRSELSD